MKQLALLLLMATTLTGCMIMLPGHLYPVQGPLAAQAPPPIYTLTLNGVLTAGTLKAILQDGEICTGDWKAVAQDDPTAKTMSDAWDSVYGPGFFVANVLGNPVFARAALTGTQGTTLNVQFYEPVPGQVTAVKGVAQDNKGNLFKLTF